MKTMWTISKSQNLSLSFMSNSHLSWTLHAGLGCKTNLESALLLDIQGAEYNKLKLANT